MSLIHEALKRAETDKLWRSPYFHNLTVLPPAQEGPPPASLPALEDRRRRRSPLVLVLAVAGMVGVGALVGLLLSERTRSPTGPRTAAGAGQPKGPGPAATSGLTPGGPRRPPGGGEADRALARTLEAVTYFREPNGPATQAVEPAGTQPAPSPAPAPAARPTPPPAPVAAPKPKPAPKPPAVNPGKYRLSAIVRGPAGNLAIINGDLVKAGETIEGAEIVNVGRYTVELEVAGQRFTIRL